MRRPTLAQSFVSAPETRNDLSHLYKGMRLHPLPEHIEFPKREQRFCENVLLAPTVYGLHGNRRLNKFVYRENTETLQNKPLFDIFAKNKFYL